MSIYVEKEEALTYQDVLLVPQYSNIKSRQEVNIGNRLSQDIDLELPLISSPMDTVSGSEMAAAMSQNGGVSVIHRYNSIEEQAKLVAAVSHEHTVGAAIGATGDYAERAHELVLAGVDFLCIDVAHGHHAHVEAAIAHIKNNAWGNIHIMAGNVATLEGFDALADWGADSVRCNIGGGSICTTRVQTGHGVPGLHTIFDCARSERAGDVKVIADGGIRNGGDIVKALAAGADFVMAGSLFAGTDQSPGKLLKTGEGWFKQYRGMASRDAQMSWRGKSSSPEGVSSMIPYKGDVNQILEELAGSIQSGFSYSGARSIQELWAKAKFIRQTGAGQLESSAHILKRYA